ncbi:MAG: DUF2203 domain-containing protein [Dehalococcoidia bacterium]
MDDFSLQEARAVLAGIRAVARDELRAPLSDADCATLVEAGVEIKDRVRGLIDFQTTIDGVPAYWCWQAGEPEVSWWHSRDGGFAGRRPVAG